MAKGTKVRPTPKRRRLPFYLKQWREYRGLTQEQLAHRVGKTQGLISQLEQGSTQYTEEMLHTLAHALNCQPADLLMRNPADTEAPWSIWETLPPVQRLQAIEIMKALKRTGTG